MDHKELTVSQPQKEEMVPAQGPVELDPSLFAFVSGGLPLNTWGSTSTQSSSTTTA